MGMIFEESQQSSECTDPIFRVGQFEEANKELVTVKPDDSLEKATTRMLMYNFSQLPVMTSEREVRGVISWRSIGSQLVLRKNCSRVEHVMEPAHVVGVDESFFDAIRIIEEYDYVLVCAKDKRITGIITATDFNLQFRKLTEPFLLIQEIEKGIRQILQRKCGKEDLCAVNSSDGRGQKIENIHNLTFGQYLQLVDHDPCWEKLQLPVDRAVFMERLNRVREIRNQVMHFNPKGLNESDLETLRNVARFLKILHDGDHT